MITMNIFLLTLKFYIFHFYTFHWITTTDVKNNKNNSQLNLTRLLTYLIHTLRDIFSLHRPKKLLFNFVVMKIVFFYDTMTTNICLNTQVSYFTLTKLLAMFIILRKTPHLFQHYSPHTEPIMKWKFAKERFQTQHPITPIKKN